MKTLRTYVGVVLILVITVCVIFIGHRLTAGLRLDLTENKLYTLSQGTRNIIQKLNQPVRLKLYYARKAALGGPEQIRYYNNYFNYVRDLLREYVRKSDGKLELSVIDPRPFSEAEEEAVEAGVEGIPLSADESFYFGLVARTELGKEKVIPFFQPDRQKFVEYDISRLLVNVTRREKRKIGMLSSLPISAGDISPYMRQMLQMQGQSVPEPWTIVQQMGERYEVVDVDEETEAVREDIDFLMVVHPKDLQEKTLFAIDQFVMRGGKLLVFTDPHCLNDRPEGSQQNPMAAMEHETSSSLNELLEGWGVRMVEDAMAADMNLAVRARVRRNAPAEHLPTYLDIDERGMNPEEVVTTQLGSVTMLFAGVLEEVEEIDVDLVPLIHTTAEGRIWKSSDPYALQMVDPGMIRRGLTGQIKEYVLGARLAGPFETNFPDGLPEENDEDDDAQNSEDEAENAAEEQHVLKKSPPDAAVIVFADVDMISDMLAYRDSFLGMRSEAGDNAALVMNSVEFLSGDRDLISVRSRGRFRRPFTVIEEIEAQTEEATARRIEELNQDIQRYRRELSQLGAAGEDEGFLESKTLQKRKELQGEIQNARRELRKLNAGKREKIEALKTKLQFHNMVWAPLMVLLVAVGLSIARYFKARYYAARRRGK